MDGNRRFAKYLMKKPWEGHKLGVKKTREVLQWACEMGIKYVTAYTLSLENLRSRPKKELEMILNYMKKEADFILNKTDHTVHKFLVKVNFIGRLNLLPKDLQEKLKRVEEKTKDYGNHVLNIAIAYGAQQEIVDAVKEIVKKGLDKVLSPADLNKDIIKNHLYTNGQPSPDLIVRTGGEKRLSNFLLYQAAYSELLFTEKKWPEITKDDFKGFLEEFASRKRRFGQ